MAGSDSLHRRAISYGPLHLLSIRGTRRAARFLSVSTSRERSGTNRALAGLSILGVVGLVGLYQVNLALALTGTLMLGPLAIGARFLQLRPEQCTLCGNVFKRNAYRWEIDSKKEWQCIYCNERMERRQSAGNFGVRGPGYG